MKKILLLCLLYVFQLVMHAQMADKIELTPDNELLGLGKQHIFKSNVLQEERPIII
jgi:hypothetical protein